MPTTTAAFTIMAADGLERSTAPSASADDIWSALEAAWQLQRHLEASVGIWDNRDGAPRKICTLDLIWH